MNKSDLITSSTGWLTGSVNTLIYTFALET